MIPSLLGTPIAIRLGLADSKKQKEVITSILAS